MNNCIQIEIPPGYNIFNACGDAILEAKANKKEVRFEFNETPMRALPESCVSDLAFIYNLKRILTGNGIDIDRE